MNIELIIYFSSLPHDDKLMGTFKQLLMLPNM